MPANIDSMAYAGDVPWHRQGTKLDNPMTAAQAIAVGGLNWEVTKEPLYFDSGRSVRVKDRFVTRRSDRIDHPDGGQLGVVGRDYHVLQNRDAFRFLDPLRLGNRAVYNTVGALDGGRRVWLLAKLPGEIRVVGDDVTEKFLLLSNSHDGTTAVRVLFTPIRVVCQNTLSMALRTTEGLSIRHHADVHDRVREAYNLLHIVNEAFDRAAVSMKAMAKVHLNQEQLKRYFEAVLPTPAEHLEVERAKALHRHARWAELFSDGDGNRMAGVRGTAWAAYNGITQWVDRESYTKRLREPLKSIWFGNGRLLKERAFTEAERLLTASAN